MKFDHDKFINLYEKQDDALNGNQASALSKLLGFFAQDRDVSDVRWAAYMLATVKHECANQWQPIEEYGKGEGMPYGNPVTVKASDGKTYTNRYYGRGYVQLTWENNYRNMSHNLNLGDEILIIQSGPSSHPLHIGSCPLACATDPSLACDSAIISAAPSAITIMHARLLTATTRQR